MTADQLRELGPKLDGFLGEFADCFARKDTRAHLGTCVRGQLSDLPQKSLEPIADAAGVPPRTLQEFMSQHKWDEDALRRRVHQTVVAEFAGPHSVGVFDETSDPKKGDKTPGVQKQWCGRLGKTENCLVTVHLAYARDEFHCLLDGELFLPESWSDDRVRCREAGIPDTMVYRPKWKIALELYGRAVGHGVTFDWLTFDEGYGSKPEFLHALAGRNQPFVAEVPRHFRGWLKPPRVVTRNYRHGGRGRGRRVPRLASGSPAARRVDALLDAPALRDQAWQRWYVKEGEKGPIVWECKSVALTVKDDRGLPAGPWRLVIARNVLNTEEVKFFVSNAKEGTGVGTLLKVAFSRWHVERCFEDQKSELGLDQFEGRRYLGLKRHLIVTSLSYLFLTRVRREWGEKSGADDLPVEGGGCGADPCRVGGGPAGIESAGREDGQKDYPTAGTKSQGPQKSYQANRSETPQARNQLDRIA